MDKKNIAILVLIVAILFLLAYIGALKYQQKQQALQQRIYEEGVRFGQLLEQKNVLTQLQTNSFYTLSFFNEKNETQTIRLGIMQPPALAEKTT